jgi:hypothetical protein
VRGVPEQAAQFGLQGVDADRLGDVGVHTGRQAAIPVFLQRVGSHGDDGQMRARRLAGANVEGRRDAVHFGHLHVHQYQHIVCLGKALQALLAIVGEVEGDTEAAEHGRRQLLVNAVVIDQQHATGNKGGGCRRAGGVTFGCFRRFGAWCGRNRERNPEPEAGA